MKPSTFFRVIARASVLPTILISIASGQAPPSPADDPQMAAATAALRSCLGATEKRNFEDAAVLGRRAEALFNARLARQPRDVEAVIGVARSLSQCVLPSADMVSQGELSTRAIELLDTALEIDPRHWTARFVRASINFRSPGFLGRAPRAAADFDELLRMQGDRTDNPRFARVFESRGMLWGRAGQADSARALWRRGARLFPTDTVLRGLSERVEPADALVSAVEATVVQVAAAPAALGAVHVVGSSLTPPAQTSEQRIDKSRVLMTAGGGADIFQAVQMQPGATRVGEGSDIYSRGGDPAETAVLVDGGRVATLSRFEGLNGSMFGAIEPFVVRAIRYSSGGFSVRHGNALSGVVEIETDGRPRERQLRAGLSLVQMSGTARLPMSKTLGGWVNARVSHTGALLATHGRSGEFVGSPFSVEAIATLISNPSPTSELRATTIVAQDDARPIVDAAGWTGPFHSAGGSRTLMLSSRWIASRVPVSVRTSVVGSTRRSDWDFGVMARVRDERDVLARADVEWAPADALTVRGGIEQGSLGRHESGVVPTSGSVAPGSGERMIEGVSSANQLGSYAEAQVAGGSSSITLGVRADRLPGESAVTVDPRIAISTQRGAWIARAGAGVFHQGRWRAQPSLPDAGTPSGLARSARHLVVGLERAGTSTLLRAESYDKRYVDFSDFGEGPRVETSSARGVDVIAQRNTGRVTGFVGYSFLDAELNVADGRTARSPFDVTHSLTTSATMQVNADWSLGTTMRYGTGAPRTPILGGEVQADGRIAPIYGTLMTERLASYARADVRVMRFVRTPHFLLTTFVEVLNVTNRHNVSALTYDAAYESQRPVHSFFAKRTIVLGGEFQFR